MLRKPRQTGARCVARCCMVTFTLTTLRAATRNTARPSIAMAQRCTGRAGHRRPWLSRPACSGSMWPICQLFSRRAWMWNKTQVLSEPLREGGAGGVPARWRYKPSPVGAGCKTPLGSPRMRWRLGKYMGLLCRYLASRLASKRNHYNYNRSRKPARLSRPLAAADGQQTVTRAHHLPRQG